MNARERFCEATRRALIDERRGNPRAALKAIRAARRMLPDRASLAVAAGECHDALGDFTRARREYATALAIDPSLARPRARLEALDAIEDAARALAPAILEAVGPLDPSPAPAVRSESVAAAPAAAKSAPVSVAAARELAPEEPRARSVVLHPQILSRVSRDGDPMVVLVAEDADLRRGGAPAWGRVDLDRLVSEAQAEARVGILAPAQ